MSANGPDPAGLEPTGVRSVQRALDILSLLTEDSPTVSVREIVEATGLAKTTVIRLVSTLEQSGLLWATANGYAAGPGLWRWAHLARRSWQLPPDTQRAMSDLAARQGETVNVYVVRDVNRVCVAQQESPRALRHVVQHRRRVAAVGRCVRQGAASRRSAESARPGRRQFALRTRGTSSGCGSGSRTRPPVATPSATANGSRGCPRSPPPCSAGTGSVVAALTLSGPTVRFGDDRVAAYVSDLVEVARRMSERGFDHPLAAAR